MPNINETKLDKIITVAYGDGTILDKIQIYAAIIINKEVRKIFIEYKNTKDIVHNNLKLELPDSIITNVNNKLGLNTQKDKTILSEIYLLFITKPFVPAAAMLIVSAAVIWSLFFSTPVHHNINKSIYTKHELDIAEKQAQYALSIVSNALTETNNTVTKDILINDVAKPINEGMTIINNLFN
ncbi:MAG: hypothetical protein V1773_12035 [bacterium]